MDIEQLKQQLDAIETEARAVAGQASNLNALREIRAKYVGKKGAIGPLMKSIREFPPEQRGPAGQVLNAANNALAGIFVEREQAIQSAESAAEAGAAGAFDPTLPGIRPVLGNVHPVTSVQREIERVF